MLHISFRVTNRLSYTESANFISLAYFSHPKDLTIKISSFICCAKDIMGISCDEEAPVAQ